MSSKRDAILDAEVTLLGTSVVNGHTKPTGLTVSRHRTFPLDPSQLPHQAVYAVNEEIVSRVPRGGNNQSIVKRRLQFCVESRCVIGSGSTADQSADPLISWSVQALCSTLPAVTGIHDIEEVGTIWDQVENDYALAGARQMFAVTYVTSASDPDATT